MHGYAACHRHSTGSPAARQTGCNCPQGDRSSRPPRLLILSRAPISIAAYLVHAAGLVPAVRQIAPFVPMPNTSRERPVLSHPRAAGTWWASCGGQQLFACSRSERSTLCKGTGVILASPNGTCGSE